MTNLNNKEIGGNYYQLLLPADYALEDNENLTAFDSGRSAIRFLLHNVACKYSNRQLVVLLPEFICESVLTPFLELNAKILFYPIETELIPNYTWMHSNLGGGIRPDIFLFETYFAQSRNEIFYRNEIFCKFISLLQSEGCYIVEDTTHSFLSKEVIEFINDNVDFRVTSLRKMSSLPDGGLLHLCSKRAEEVIRMNSPVLENTKFLDKRLRAQSLKRESFNTNSSKQMFINAFEESAQLLNCNHIIYTMSQYSRSRFYNIDFDAISKQRRENYQVLLEEISGLATVKRVIDHLEDDVVPIYFPIFLLETAERDNIRRWLRDREILCPIIWPCPKALIGRISSETMWIYAHILCLPCDQRYGTEEMKYLTGLLKEYFEQ